MEWMLVIVVMGTTPVKTDMTFTTLQECLDVEDQTRAEIAEVYNKWRSWASSNPTVSGFPSSEPFMSRRIGMQNVATCIPHAPIGD